MSIKLRLAVGELAFLGFLGSDEAEVDGVEVQEFAGGDAFLEHLVPGLGAGGVLAFDGEGLGVPVGDVEPGLLQGDDVGDLVDHHAGPVEGLAGGAGAGQGHDLAGAGADGGDERLAGGSAAEPFVVLHDLNLGAAGGLEPEPLDQGIMFFFEEFGQIFAQKRVLVGEDEDGVVIGLDGLVIGHVAKDEHHVLGADVEGVGVEGGDEEVVGLVFAADLHVEHAEADAGLEVGGVGLDGAEVGAFGGVVLAAVGEAFAHRGVEDGGFGVDGAGGGLGGGHADGIDEEPVGGGESAQGGEVFGVLGHGFFGGVEGLVEPLVGDVQVGQQDHGGSVAGVDFKGVFHPFAAGGELVAFEVGLSEGDDDLGGVGVDAEGAGELAEAGALLVAGEEEAAFEPGGLPAFGVGAEGGFVDGVDDLVEAVGQVLAGGLGPVVAFGGLADGDEGLGVASDLGGVVVLVVHEPFVGGDGLLALARGLPVLGLHPAGAEVVGVGLEGFFDLGGGLVPVAAVELVLGQGGEEVGVVLLVDEGGFELLAGLAVFALTFEGGGDSEGVAGLGLGVGVVEILEGLVERLLRLGIFAGLPEVLGVVKGVRESRWAEARLSTLTPMIPSQTGRLRPRVRCTMPTSLCSEELSNRDVRRSISWPRRLEAGSPFSA